MSEPNEREIELAAEYCRGDGYPRLSEVFASYREEIEACRDGFWKAEILRRTAESIDTDLPAPAPAREDGVLDVLGRVIREESAALEAIIQQKARALNDLEAVTMRNMMATHAQWLASLRSRQSPQTVDYKISGPELFFGELWDVVNSPIGDEEAARKCEEMIRQRDNALLAVPQPSPCAKCTRCDPCGPPAWESYTEAAPQPSPQGEDDLPCLTDRPMHDEEECANYECPLFNPEHEQNCSGATADEGPAAETCREWRTPCRAVAALRARFDSAQSSAQGEAPEGWPSWQAKAEEMERNWHGATETHNQVRALYDVQNAELQRIIEGKLSPDAPAGFAKRLLGMSMEDREYLLSVSAAVISAQGEEAREGWISVEDRLPEIGQTVIAYRPTAHLHNDDPITNCVYTGKITHSFEGIKHRFSRINHPSHWMPLPEPPEAHAALGYEGGKG